MDTTAIFYTSNQTSEHFARNIQSNLLDALDGIPLISVSQRPMDFGENIVVDFKPSHINIYRQALIGAKEAKTKYIACCEDDCLYTKDHFAHVPSPGKFAYNFNVWNCFTWGKPLFHRKDGGRRNMYSLICERDLFIEAIEERFKKWPDDSKINLGLWAEPSRYERQLGVTVREYEVFYSKVPLIAFSHQTALSYKNLGTRKKQGAIQALEIPVYGSAEDVIKLYG